MNDDMNKGLLLIGGMGLGAGLMYLFDPDRGNRRRALIRDQVISALSQTDDVIGKTSRDLSNRAYGLMAEARSLLTSEEVPDEVLVERVRAKMGRYVSHPHAIGVTASQGRVTLSGPILKDKVDQLISAVSSVRSVKGVENRLEVHEHRDHMPALQGGVRRPGEKFELMQANWTPAARFLVGAAGGALAFYGVRRRDMLGGTLGISGLSMLTRAITNIEMKRLLGGGGGRRAVDIQKTLNVNAPVEEVFAFWRNFENFPRFMSNVREVRDLGEGRSHWTVAGPTGISVEWDAVITKLVPNEVLAWKSLPGSTIANAGIIHFQPNPDGSTRVDIKLSYNPPAGALGHAIATIFGADPKTEMDEDLVRFKSLIEEGKATAHDETVTREEVAGEALERGGEAER